MGALNRNNVLGYVGRRSAVHHSVSVLHAHSIGSTMRLDDVHHSIVGVSQTPIALPLEHRRKRGHGYGSGLHHALHRVSVRERAAIAAAAIFDTRLKTPHTRRCSGGRWD